MEKEIEIICIRTWRLCENGAWDGNDGLGIDCMSTSPVNCIYRKKQNNDKKIWETHPAKK